MWCSEAWPDVYVACSVLSVCLMSRLWCRLYCPVVQCLSSQYTPIFIHSTVKVPPSKSALLFLFFPPLSTLCTGRASWDWIYGYGTIHFDSKSSRSCSVDAIHFWLALVPPLNHVVPRLTDWSTRCNSLKLQTPSVHATEPSNIINMDVTAS